VIIGNPYSQNNTEVIRVGRSIDISKYANYHGLRLSLIFVAASILNINIIWESTKNFEFLDKNNNNSIQYNTMA